MTEPLIIGLTGPTGSGKSTVAQSLEEAGCVVIDADKIAREVVAPGAPALKELQREFGDAILDDYGNLRRHIDFAGRICLGSKRIGGKDKIGWNILYL